ncbi:hypothetical protein [Winogradskyella aurantia]|uniref:Restriction endonuclease n=1 Tax=Winogradskyella aurantia TaxID=1915063 RepID=A0A265USY7_9FLAO|nr:hypothetical protein [Winogradskyella aurantia]OZV68416.1 hypothetical protein CA834_08015 [Winogradskyella aurantia]
MGANHDLLADKAGRAIVSKIVNRVDNWGQVFSDNLNKAGDFSWPRPDYVCFDYDLDQSVAFEFKPPNHSKREYLTGLGQTLSYLEKHHYSGIILPTFVEGYNIAQHLTNILSLDVFSRHYISVIGYNERTLESDPLNSIQLFKPIEHERTGEIVTEHINETYWCWWRDISHYEIFTLLNLLDKYASEPGDIYTNNAWPEFWRLMVNGQTRTWEGAGRTKTDNETNYRSEKQNYKIPLFQLGLIEPSEGRLTAEGYKLISIGKIFGIESSLYMDYLTKLVLIEGKHLILIQDLEDYKTRANSASLANSTQFRKDFETYLDENNSIGQRKEGRTTTGNKESYIRDELKLWNKLGLLKTRGTRYFTVGRGIEFNWARITEILTKDFLF